MGRRALQKTNRASTNSVKMIIINICDHLNSLWILFLSNHYYRFDLQLCCLSSGLTWGFDKQSRAASFVLGLSANLKCIYVFSRPLPSAQRLRWSVGHVRHYRRHYHRHYHRHWRDISDKHCRRSFLECASSIGVYTSTHRAGRWTEGEDFLLTLVHLPSEP